MNIEELFNQFSKLLTPNVLFLVALRTEALKIIGLLRDWALEIPQLFVKVLDSGVEFLGELSQKIPPSWIIFSVELVIITTLLLFWFFHTLHQGAKLKKVMSKIEQGILPQLVLKRFGLQAHRKYKTFSEWSNQFHKQFDENFGEWVTNFLETIHDAVEDWEVVKNPQILIDGLKKLKELAAPILNFFIHPFKTLTASWGKKESLEERFLLMDTGRQSTNMETDDLHKILYDTEVYFPDSWKNTLETVEKRWQNQTISSLVILGSSGMGKTSAIKAMAELWKKNPSRHLICKRGQNIFDDLEIKEYLLWPTENLEELPRKILFVDDINQLFQRKVGGYSQLLQFFQMIERTKSRLLWVVTCLPESWKLMSFYAPVAQIFPFKLDWSDVTVEELLQCYDKKFSKAGLDWLPLPDEKAKFIIKNKIKHKSLGRSEVPAYLKKLFFQRLFDGENPGFEFISHYLLKNAVGQSKNTIKFDFAQVYNLNAIKNLPDESLFILQAFFYQEPVSKDVLAESLLMSSTKTSIQLSLLLENNIIQKTGERFKLFAPIIPQIRQYLKTKNLLEAFE